MLSDRGYGGIFGSRISPVREDISKDSKLLKKVMLELGYEFSSAKPIVKRQQVWIGKSGDGPSTGLTREVVSTLDLPGKKPFNRLHSTPIKYWIEALARMDSIQPYQLELLSRVVMDIRFSGPSRIKQILKKPSVARALLPVALNTLEASKHAGEFKYNFTIAHQIAHQLDAMNREFLRPHSKQIAALSKRYNSVRDVVGRLDIDPTPYLLPLEYPNTLIISKSAERDLSSKLRGACMADDKWSFILIPELQKAADNAPVPKGPGEGYSDPLEYRLKLANVLARYGDLDRAKALLLKPPSKNTLKNLESRSNPNFSLSKRCQ